MTNHPWGGSTPEMNAGVLETGSTSATWAAASSAWLGLASATLAALGITGAQMNASLASISGTRSVSAAAVTPPFLAWLGGMAGIAFKQAAICAVVAESYGVARTTMIPSVQSINNRVREAAAEASNIFGQNTPLIGALNAEYGMYTMNNAAIGNTYGEVITAATLPVPIPPPPPLASAAKTAGEAAQSTAQAAQLVGQAGGGKATQAATQASSQLGQTTGSSSQAVSQLTGQMGQVGQVFQAPLQALQSLGQGLTSPFQSISQLLTAPLSAFGSSSGMGNLLGGGSTGASFTPALSTGGGLPLGGNGLGAGGAGLGGGGGLGGLGGGLGQPTNKLAGSSTSGATRTSVLSGISTGPMQERLAGAQSTPMGGVPPAGTGAGGRVATSRRAGETAVLTYGEGKNEPSRRRAEGDERELFT